MASVDKEKATDVIHLELCKAFDMIPHHILKLERYGFEGWTIRWLKNWLDDHSQRIVFSGSRDSISRWRPVMSDFSKAAHLGTSGLQYLYQ